MNLCKKQEKGFVLIIKYANIAKKKLMIMIKMKIIIYYILNVDMYIIKDVVRLKQENIFVIYAGLKK